MEKTKDGNRVTIAVDEVLKDKLKAIAAMKSVKERKHVPLGDEADRALSEYIRKHSK